MTHENAIVMRAAHETGHEWKNVLMRDAQGNITAARGTHHALPTITELKRTSAALPRASEARAFYWQTCGGCFPVSVRPKNGR
jgi:hypothetical protein